jgi:hypothetical protein
LGNELKTSATLYYLSIGPVGVLDLQSPQSPIKLILEEAVTEQISNPRMKWDNYICLLFIYKSSSHQI